MNTAGARTWTASGVSPDPVSDHGVALSPAHSRVQVRAALADSCLLALSCLISYWIATTILALAHSPSQADDLLGGMWAVIATVFVVRHSYSQSAAAALSRMAATLVSFALCLAYLAFLPFHAWALAALIGLSALVVTLLGRPGDAITAAITTAVVMVAAELAPHDAWQQPILRLADTAIGVAVGIAAAWIGLRVLRRQFGSLGRTINGDADAGLIHKRPRAARDELTAIPGRLRWSDPKAGEDAGTGGPMRSDLPTCLRHLEGECRS